MGTSTGYGMPTGGDWTPLKTDATQFVKDDGNGPISPAKLLRSYLRAHGGASGIARGDGGRAQGGGGRRGSGGPGGSGARKVGRNIGSFLSAVGSIGLDGALREAGLVHLIGKPAAEVSAGLLDALSDPGSTLDDHAARIALAKLNDELLAGTETYEDVGHALAEVLDQQGLVSILARFFGYYVYERFCRDFYERWRKKVGAGQADRSLKSIKDYIQSRLQVELLGQDVMQMTWRGNEGMMLTEQILQDTLKIFEVMG
jgi:hypothetical protein